MKRDGFYVYTPLPRAALTSDLCFCFCFVFLFFFFLEKAAPHIAGFKVNQKT